jgi:hypothetical protein
MLNYHQSYIPPQIAKKIKNTEPDFWTFLAISEVLTGFSTAELWSTGMLDIYYYTVMKELDQEQLRAFFKVSVDILGDAATMHQRIREEFIPIPRDSKIRPKLQELPFQGLAQRIMLMWYNGIWTSIDGNSAATPSISTYMVSTAAYINGLNYATAETHPAGARQPGYNSWSKAPITT